jgi:hypothetical protein
MPRPRKTEDRKTLRQDDKPVRVPFGAHRYKLQLSEPELKEFKRRKMVPRWINDRDGRIERALAGGYNFVDPKYARSLGQSAIHEGNQDEGSRVSKIANRGDNVGRAFLMEIKEKYYKEDQQTKQELVDKVDEDLRAGQAGGAQIENQYGTGVTYSH